MGLLDWVKTPEGQALASAVAGYAANARRGQPINSIGRGLGAGIGAYGNALQSQEAARQREIQNAYNQRMMGYNERQAETSALKAETDRKRAEQKFRELKGLADADVKMFGAMFPGQKFQSNILDDDYEIINAVWDDGTPAQGMTVAQAKEKAVIPEFKVNEGMAKMYGFTPEDLQYVQGIYAMDPKSAIKEMAEIRKATRKGGKEARDAIAKERAIAEAMGMPVGDYLKQKFNKPSGVNVNVQNVMPGEAAEKAGQKEGYDIGEQAAMIENKYSAIDSVREAKDTLNKGIYSGYWGDLRQTIAKASLGAVGDRQKAARTEEFMAYIGNTVVPRLKEFGGNDSNEEMRYLQKIMGGDTSMEPEAIAKILESAERKIQRGIERLQRQRVALEQGRMPDLGPGPSRFGTKQPVKPAPVQQKNKLSPAEQAELEQLRKRFGK